MKPAPAASDHDDVHIEVGEPKTWAAGLPAVIETARQVGAQMGWRKGARTLLRLNQPDGFDCPGCAWPEPHHTSRVRVLRERRQGRRRGGHRPRGSTPAFFAEHSIAELAGETDYWLGQQGRLTDADAPAAGRDALPADRLGRRVRPHRRPTLADAGDRRTAPSSTRRAARATRPRSLYQLFVRALGTNNLPDCSNMCHESSGVALERDDRHRQGHASRSTTSTPPTLILVVGQNPGTNHPRMLTALEQAKRNGAPHRRDQPAARGRAAARSATRRRRQRRASAAAPRSPTCTCRSRSAPTWRCSSCSTAAWSHDGDAARPGVRRRALRRLRRAAPPTCDALDPDALLAATGLDARRGRRAVPSWSPAAERIIVCWAMGLTQHRQAVATIREIVNILLLRGEHRQAGRRRLPGARPHQRAGRPHDGHLREAAGRVPRRARGASSASTRRASHGYDTVDAIRRDARRRGRRVRRPWAATSWPRRPTPT